MRRPFCNSSYKKSSSSYDPSEKAARGMGGREKQIHFWVSYGSYCCH